MVPRQGREKVQFNVFSKLDAFGVQKTPHGRPGDLQEHFYMSLTGIGNKFGSLFAMNTKRSKKNVQRTWPRNRLHNEWQLLPQRRRMALTCANTIIEPMRGGGVGRSPLDIPISFWGGVVRILASFLEKTHLEMRENLSQPYHSKPNSMLKCVKMRKIQKLIGTGHTAYHNNEHLHTRQFQAFRWAHQWFS